MKKNANERGINFLYVSKRNAISLFGRMEIQRFNICQTLE
jgi:hypothetical protein